MRDDPEQNGTDHRFWTVASLLVSSSALPPPPPPGMC